MRLFCLIGWHSLELNDIVIDGGGGAPDTWETWEFYHGTCTRCGATVYRKVCTV